MILIGSYEQLFVNKLNNLQEMDTFPEIYNLPRLNQEEIQNQNRPVMCKETESVIKNLPTQISPEPDAFTG